MGKPDDKRVLAIDLGKARVGVAVSDELGAFAHPRPSLDGQNKKALLERLVALVKDDDIGKVLVGLPVGMGGEHGPAARAAHAFAVELANAAGVEVELVDERLSTVDALRQLRASGKDARKAKSKVDGVAAALLLQAWLDARPRG